MPIGALHGREAIADLELEEATGADRREIDRRIEARALRHRIVSRRTSLVAVAEEPSVDPLAPRRRERLAVELPAGVSAEGVGVFAASRPIAGRMLSAARPIGRSMGLRDRGVGPSPDDVDLSRSEFAVRDLDPPGAVRESGDAGFFDRIPGVMSRLLGSTGGSHRQPTRPGRPGRPGRDGRPPVRWIAAEVLNRSPEILTVEFEVPAGGIPFPTGRVRVRLADGREVEATVDSSLSTPAGDHPAGVRVRLALRSGAGNPWPVGRRVELSWIA